MSNQLNAQDLKTALWDSLKAVKSGQMQPAHADSIAGLGREILRTVKVQLQVSNQSERTITTYKINNISTYWRKFSVTHQKRRMICAFPLNAKLSSVIRQNLSYSFSDKPFFLFPNL